jgi:hypothetical protein
MAAVAKIITPSQSLVRRMDLTIATMKEYIKSSVPLADTSVLSSTLPPVKNAFSCAAVGTQMKKPQEESA